MHTHVYFSLSRPNLPQAHIYAKECCCFDQLGPPPALPIMIPSRSCSSAEKCPWLVLLSDQFPVPDLVPARDTVALPDITCIQCQCLPLGSCVQVVWAPSPACPTPAQPAHPQPSLPPVSALIFTNKNSSSAREFSKCRYHVYS